MFRSHVVIALLLFHNFDCFAQKEANNWFFGKKAGLNFSTGNPVVLEGSQMESFQGSAVISDNVSGELLFYSNGESVWNRAHQIMPNGNGLSGSNKATQAALIVPNPRSKDLFYLFTVSDATANEPLAKIHYSMIDMRMGNGLGDVTSSAKDIFLIGGMTEKLTAVPHANGTDYWLITHQMDSNHFLVFLISESGISIPNIYAIGSIHKINSHPVDLEDAGYLKASPDGSKLAVAVTNGKEDRPFDLFDFNSSTGEISNYTNLGNFAFQWGVSFSPDNTKLYLRGINVDIPPPTVNIDDPTNDIADLLHQFDLLAEDVRSSRVGLLRTNPRFDDRIIASPTLIAAALQIALNGKIYMAGSSFQETQNGLLRNTLLVIEEPNAKGINSNVKVELFPFGMDEVIGGLPNFIQSTFNGLTPQDNPNTPCTASDNFNLFPNPSGDFVQIEISEKCFTPYELTLYDVMGKKLGELAISEPLSDRIDLQPLADGIYFAVIEPLLFSNESRISKRIVKRVVKN